MFMGVHRIGEVIVAEAFFTERQVSRAPKPVLHCTTVVEAGTRLFGTFEQMTANLWDLS